MIWAVRRCVSIVVLLAVAHDASHMWEHTIIAPYEITRQLISVNLVESCVETSKYISCIDRRLLRRRYRAIVCVCQTQSHTYALYWHRDGKQINHNSVKCQFSCSWKVKHSRSLIVAKSVTVDSIVEINCLLTNIIIVNLLSSFIASFIEQTLILLKPRNNYYIIR